MVSSGESVADRLLPQSTTKPRYTRCKSNAGDELRSFRFCLRFMCMDQSSTFQALVSWSLFLLLGVVVPAVSHFVLDYSPHRRPYDCAVQLSLTLASALAFLRLSAMVSRYGLRKVLFLDKVTGESDRVRLGYTEELSRSFTILACFLAPCTAAEASYKVWWYWDGSGLIPFLGNAAASDALAFTLELASWVYRTGSFFIVCVLFRVICQLQILRLQDFAAVFREESEVAAVLKEHLRIRRQLRVISHRFRSFIIGGLVLVTASQFGALLLTTRPHAEVNLFNGGELAMASSSNEPARPEFEILDLEGKDYHRWVSDVETTFIGKKLTNTIKPPKDDSDEPQATVEAKAQALMFLRRHIHPSLKKHYLSKTDPNKLWEMLKLRFNNVHDAQLPELTAQWENTRMLDFSKVNAFNQAMLDLQSDLSFCGVIKTDEDMIERALQTFPTSQSLLAHQYRIEFEQGRISSFADLINSLSKKEKHHEILLNNNQRPAGTKAESHFAGGKAKKNRHPACHEPYRGGSSNRGGRNGRGRGRGRNLTWYRDQNSAPHQNQSGSVQSASNSGKYACFKCGSLKHMHKQCHVSKEMQLIYKKHKQYLAQESNYTGEYEDPEANATLVLAAPSDDFLETPDFQ